MLDGLKNKLKKTKEFSEHVADEKYISNKYSEVNKTAMIALERTELIARCHGFSREDWEIIINEAPIELCHNRIGRELKEAKEFRKSIDSAMSGVGNVIDFSTFR